MPVSVTLPALGESVTEGTVTRWLKKEGDTVAVDEPLLEISTDKVDTEIPAPVSGTLLSISVQEDETVDVGAALAVIAYDYSLAGNARSEIIGTTGSIKVVRVKDGPVIGVHGIGSRVGELIGEAQLVVNWEAYPEDIAPFIHAHPTQYEALGEAFLALAGKPLHAL